LKCNCPSCASFFSCTKWCCTSMCFVLAWYIGSLASAMAPWMSHMINQGALIILAPHIISTIWASLVQWLAAMYSASVVDEATVAYLLLHSMTPLHPQGYSCIARGGSPIIYASPAQSASQYPFNFMCCPPSCNFKCCRLPLRDLMMPSNDSTPALPCIGSPC
jgi:hypothetical protein